MYGKFDKLKAAGQPTSMAKGFGFEEALRLLKGGRKLTRAGWNGQGMFIYMVGKRSTEVGSTDETEPLVGVRPAGMPIEYSVRVDMLYANGRLGVWSPTFDDLFATDWSPLT